MFLFTKSYVTTGYGTNPAFCSTGKKGYLIESKEGGA
jgi:hypothetical protein